MTRLYLRLLLLLSFNAFVSTAVTERRSRSVRQRLLDQDHSYSEYVGYHNHRNKRYPSDSYYSFEEDPKWQYKSPPTSFRRIALCWGMALAWTVWMLRSLVKSEFLRYSTESITVRGHVLEVRREDDSSMGGIPVYKAVIDYMIDDAQEQKHIQIRKQFETQTFLEQGFANVELLVLPEEPTSSVLKEDFQQQVEELSSDRSVHGGCGAGCRACFCRLTFWKRVWIAFCVGMIMFSLAGSIVAAHRLPSRQRNKGFVLVCFGFALLIPAALVLKLIITRMERFLQYYGSNPSSYIYIQGAAKSTPWCGDVDALDPSYCDDELLSSESKHHQIQLATQRQMAQQQQPGCYVIHFPNLVRQHESEVSDVSSTSGGSASITLLNQHSSSMAAMGHAMIGASPFATSNGSKNADGASSI